MRSSEQYSIEAPGFSARETCTQQAINVLPDIFPNLETLELHEIAEDRSLDNDNVKHASMSFGDIRKHPNVRRLIVDMHVDILPWGLLLHFPNLEVLEIQSTKYEHNRWSIVSDYYEEEDSDDENDIPKGHTLGSEDAQILLQRGYFWSVGAPCQALHLKLLFVDRSSQGFWKHLMRYIHVDELILRQTAESYNEVFDAVCAILEASRACQITETVRSM